MSFGANKSGDLNAQQTWCLYIYRALFFISEPSLKNMPITFLSLLRFGLQVRDGTGATQSNTRSYGLFTTQATNIPMQISHYSIISIIMENL
jgi:hypothetical protein